LFACVLGCGTPPAANEPTTAKEKQLRDAKASGEIDPREARWGGWRYQGDRKDCFFVVGRKCFKTEKAACDAAKCKAGTKCTADGGGPATISCK
jgi:hypothetical protein